MRWEQMDIFGNWRECDDKGNVLPDYEFIPWKACYKFTDGSFKWGEPYEATCRKIAIEKAMEHLKEVEEEFGRRVAVIEVYIPHLEEDEDGNEVETDDWDWAGEHVLMRFKLEFKV